MNCRCLKAGDEVGIDMLAIISRFTHSYPQQLDLTRGTQDNKSVVYPIKLGLNSWAALLDNARTLILEREKLFGEHTSHETMTCLASTRGSLDHTSRPL